MVGMIFPVVGLLIKTKFFSGIIAKSAEDEAPAELSKNGKIAYWIFGAVTIILTFLALRHANNDLPPHWAGGFTKSFLPISSLWLQRAPYPSGSLSCAQ